jgi:hypothetical protein
MYEVNGTHAEMPVSTCAMLVKRLALAMGRCTAARGRRPAWISGWPVWRPRWQTSSSLPRSTDCDASARLIRLDGVRKHGCSGGTAAALMPLAPAVSRSGHAPRSNDRPAGGKQRPAAHPFSPEVSSRTVVIAALVTSLLLAAGATGVFQVRRRLRGKPRRLIVRDEAGAPLHTALRREGHLASRRCKKRHANRVVSRAQVVLL